MLSFSRLNHPSASGYLGALLLIPPSSRRRGCSPLASPSGRFGPLSCPLQAHATELSFTKPARRAARPSPPARLTARGHPGRYGCKHECHPFPQPNQPSSCGDLVASSLNPSIVPPAMLLAHHPALQATRALSCIPTSSCHRAAIFQACPTLRAPEPSRASNRARSPRQMRLHARMASFSRRNHPSACGDLGVSSLSPSPAASAAITSLQLAGNLSTTSSAPISARLLAPSRAARQWR